MKIEKVLMLILLCLLLGLMAYYWRLSKYLPSKAKASSAHYAIQEVPAGTSWYAKERVVRVVGVAKEV